MDRFGYRKSRTLASLNHLGTPFRVVRARINGKPWRGYLTVVHDDMAVDSNAAGLTDVDAYMTRVRDLLDHVYPAHLTASADSLRERLSAMRHAYAGTP